MNDHLPELVKRASTRLAQASTAAEVLDARTDALLAYDRAKRLASLADAGSEMRTACNQVMADVIEIEVEVSRRLADEYDAAQQRGEVQAPGGNRGNQHANIPKENNATKVADLGLTSKQIHEARQVRDAVKRQPDAVRMMLDAKLKAGAGPTHADLRRTVKQTNGDDQPSPKRRSKFGAEKENEIARMVLDQGMTKQQAAVAAGVSDIVVRKATAIEQGRREERADPQIDPASLSLSARQKLDAAIRQHKRNGDAELAEQRAQLVAEFDQLRIDWLRKFNERQAEYDAVISARKGVMTRKTFDAIRRCLHPDSRDSVSSERLAEAFRLFSKLELKLLPESDFPTRRFRPLNPADLIEAKMRADEARREKANGKREMTRR
jgi:hypothetical protein